MNSVSASERLALVIGATGGIGGETAKALLAHGWRVRALTRDPRAASQRAAWVGPVEWVAGDAMNAADVAAAAEGAAILVHAANPPGYRNWRGLAVPMLGNSLAAARASGARLILPGNVYNYGPDAWPVLREDSPQHPLTRKGAIRVEMEASLKEAAGSGVRSLVVRAGDFFGAHQPASWFKDMMIKPGRPLRSVVYPGDPAAGHAWAYLPDLAETIARLSDIEQTLPAFETVHFGGHWVEPGIELAKAIARAAGRPEAKIKKAPWLMIRLASPFVEMFRELLEMRYLWRVPVRLDNGKLRKLLGEEPHTPLDDALREVLAALGVREDSRGDVA
jgi:nucleoside-diphosphate-sugar epimerase